MNVKQKVVGQIYFTTHFPRTLPADTIRSWFCGRSPPYFSVVEVHYCKPVKLATSRGDCEVHSDPIELAAVSAEDLETSFNFTSALYDLDCF
jgi:hypothetical protein